MTDRVPRLAILAEPRRTGQAAEECTTARGPPTAEQVTFVDVAVQDLASFRPDQDRVWLLKATSEPGLFGAPASYESVLVATEEPRVRALLSAAVPSAASKQRN